MSMDDLMGYVEGYSECDVIDWTTAGAGKKVTLIFQCANARNEISEETQHFVDSGNSRKTKVQFKAG